MKNSTRKLVGVAALLFSSAGMAATVTVTPSTPSPVAPNSAFSLTVSGSDFPSTAGTTLGLNYNSSFVSVSSVTLAPNSPFTGCLVATAPFNLISVLGPLTGTLPSGSFDAFVINFQAVGQGDAGIELVDDQLDLCWADAV